jgi:hypothetical protein
MKMVVQLKLLLLMHKCVHNTAPAYLTGAVSMSMYLEVYKLLDSHPNEKDYL